MPEEQSETPLDITAVDAGLSSINEKSHPDLRDRLEDAEVEASLLKNELARSQIKDVEADREMRKTYASRILGYLEAYSLYVGVLVFMTGMTSLHFLISEKVLVVLVGSTAVAAIGLVGFVAKGLFKPPS